MPWVSVRRASLQRDFRHFRDVHINSVRGTTMLVDLWVELRITDPKKALYDVADWDRSLQNLVQHAAIAILGSRDFQQILTDRIELGELLKRDLGGETARWGVAIEQVYVRNVSLLPEVSRQVLATIAARLERAKADIEEDGRLLVAQLESQISLQVAPLVADAKGQYPAALDRAFSHMAREPAVLTAYNELYELSLVRPHRTITFTGFGDGELGAAEAMMAAPPLSENPPPGYGLPLLSSEEDRVGRPPAASRAAVGPD
jgi:regulator of protease activity HflC (stomatin/prohibitin superfamily)